MVGNRDGSQPPVAGRLQQNLDRVKNLIHFGVGYFWEVPVRLVVLPEYFMQGVGTPGKGEWKILQDFLKNPEDVAGTQAKLEADAAAAYGN